jgi:hypothetical protein
MVSTRGQKRYAADSGNPLRQAGILLNILAFVGPGHWYFISAVSKLWKDLYEKVKSERTAIVIYYDVLFGGWFNCTPQMTLFSSVCASSSRVRLAHAANSGCLKDPRHEYFAGRYADQATLVTAHELGLQFSPHVLTGALRAGDHTKAMWLYTEQHCGLGNHYRVCAEAAMGGSIEVLAWLKQQGVDPTGETCVAAARHDQLPVLQYLHAEGILSSRRVCDAAARRGDLVMLKWAITRGTSTTYARQLYTVIM